MDWIPALTSTAILGIIGFTLSVPYRKAVEASLTAAFDSKLERTKADLRREEERLRADLRARDAEIDGLRSGALSSLAARHSELGRRRILAVERVWAHVVGIAHLKTLSQHAKALRVDVMLERADQSTEARKSMSEFAEIVLQSAGVNELKPFDNSADKEQPFLPEITWALFLAYRQLLTSHAVPFHLLKAGVSPKGLLADSSKLASILKNALPHRSAFLDERGAQGFPYLVEELERTLLASLRQALNQDEADREAVDQAARIMAAVNDVARERTAAGVPAS